MAEINVDLWNLLQQIENEKFTVERLGNNRFNITGPDGNTTVSYNATGRPDLAVKNLTELLRNEFSWIDTTIHEDDDLHTKFRKYEAARALERRSDPDWNPEWVTIAEQQARAQLANNKMAIRPEYIGPWEAFQLLDAHETARTARGLSEDAELDIRAIIAGEPFVRQRKVSKKHKTDLGQIVRLGHFMLTHQGIAVAEDGYLLDGQHRLWTVLEQGLPIAILVARNVPNEIFPVIDTGKRRTGADALHIMGVQNASAVHATIRCLYWYDYEPDWRKWYNRTISEKEVIDLLMSDYQTVGESCDLAKRAVKGGNLKIQPAVVAAVTHIVLRADPRAPIEDFWSTTAGTGAPAPLWYDLYGTTYINDCPTYALRNWAERWNKRGRSGLRSTEHLICSIRAYNEALKGARHKRIVFNDSYEVPRPNVFGALNT